MRSLLCALLLAICLAPAPADTPQLVWLTSLDQALRVSSVQARPLLVEVTTRWSPLARQMAHTTWQHDSVRQLAAHYVLLRLDAEREPYFANHWNVDGYPTYLLIYKGNDLGRDVGVVPPAEMVTLLNAGLARFQAVR